jgi:hypothetical protein
MASPTNLQDALYGGSGLFIREVLLEAVVSDEADRRAGVVLDVLEIDAGVTLRHRRGTCSARCSAASDGFGRCEAQPDLRAVRGDARALP